jgi:hypothetical protein
MLYNAFYLGLGFTFLYQRVHPRSTSWYYSGLLRTKGVVNPKEEDHSCVLLSHGSRKEQHAKEFQVGKVVKIIAHGNFAYLVF